MKKKLPTFLISFFVIIQPFLDLYIMHTNSNLEIAGFKILTIIRYFGIFLLGLYYLYKTKLKISRKQLIVFGVLLIIYIIAHHINAQMFDTSLSKQFPYSFVEEIFYIARYLIPIFIILYLESFDQCKEIFKKTLVIYGLIISLIVIISNVFYLARSSYSNFIIDFNIFDWFIKDISHYNASSKGFFYSTSVITALLITTPYIYSIYYKEKKYIYLFTIFANLIALMMVGTRACTFGAIIISIIMFIMYISFSIYEKKFKENIGISIAALILVGTFCTIFPFSPGIERFESINNTTSPTIENDDKNDEHQTNGKLDFDTIYNLNDPEKREEEIINYIKININNLGILPDLIIRYSYKYDYEFWADIIKNETEVQKADNRYIEEKILKRIKNINNNKMDDWLGITYSRATKAYNLEKDFTYQYYTLGILGIIILILPLIVILLYNMFKIVTKKDLFNIENCSLCLGIGLIFCIAYYSGDILDNLGTNIIIGYVLGYLLKNVKGNL